MKNRIAIFASGGGTNAEEIIRYFEKSKDAEVSLILSNKPDAFVLERAKNHNIPAYTFDREEFRREGSVIPVLEEHGITHVVLAGFLWLVPEDLVNRYEGKIVNIHPALLPKYGGKGMYGMNVHKAVIEAGEEESGISIHFVNPVYDEGNIIFQARCKVEPNDTPESLAQKIHALEYAHYPRVIEEVIND